MNANARMSPAEVLAHAKGRGKKKPEPVRAFVAEGSRWDAGAFVATLPLWTPNPLNGGQWARFVGARRRKEQRGTTSAFVSLWGRRLPRLPVVVTLTRIAPGMGLDKHDGLPASLKGCVDGVADALGLPDDRDGRVEWRYAQRRERAWGVEIRVEGTSK
jgi:hypothetical protein